MNVDRDGHVLIWAPRGRDASLAVRLLGNHGVPTLVCRSPEEIVESLDAATCAVLTHEALTASALGLLESAIEKQPPWSDFPFVLLVPRPEGGKDHARAWRALGNVTVLERPTQSRTLLSAVSAARRARRRQHEVREAIMRRDQFLAMLGHELRNPLGAITLAMEMRGTGDAATAERQHDIITRQVRHLSRLVDDLLGVARVTTGKVALHPVALDLNEILDRCLEGAEMNARARSIEIHRMSPSGPLCVSGDAVRLEEVFANLISNAIKFSSTQSRIEVVASAVGGQAVIEVKDSGVGIAPEMLPRVFDLFAQADVSLDRTQAGLGVGLTLVKALIELHSGSVEAQSDGTGKGSCFTVRLPLLGADALATPALDAPFGSVDTALMNVLVVDDNADLLELTKDVLEGFGCQVQTACDGPSGLAQLTSSEPAVAFIDIGLPGLDGYEIATEVRAVRRKQPWLVALTGYGQPEDKKRALAAGFDQHLTKPVTIEALKLALGNASGAQSRQRLG